MSIAARGLHGINVCVIPNPDNDYRPLVLRHKPLAFVSAFLILIKLVAIGVVGLTPSYAELSTITVDRITQLTNAERTKQGLAPLKTNAKLAAAAREKGEHMLEEDYFAHISPSGVTPWFWMAKAGYTYQIAGENLAIDFTEAEDVVAAWIASPSHRENMLQSAYTETGVAVVTGEFQGGTSIIVVHMFGNPTGAQVAAEVITATPTPSPAPTQTPAAPTPTPSPTPTPIPATPLPDTEAPRIPRIALTTNTETVGSSVTISFEGEPSSTAHLLVNNQVRANVVLSEAGTAQQKVNLLDIEDGTIVLRVYGSDSTGNRSELSDPLAIQKDTQGPQIAEDQLTIVIAPNFDQHQAILFAPEGYESFSVRQNDTELVPTNGLVRIPQFDTFSVQVRDTTQNTTVLENLPLAPQFEIEQTNGELQTPQRINQLSRRLAASVLVSTLLLLMMAIIIRIRIQHPALITHATFVVLLAGILFFW